MKVVVLWVQQIKFKNIEPAYWPCQTGIQSARNLLLNKLKLYTRKLNTFPSAATIFFHYFTIKLRSKFVSFLYFFCLFSLPLFLHCLSELNNIFFVHKQTFFSSSTCCFQIKQNQCIFIFVCILCCAFFLFLNGANNIHRLAKSELSQNNLLGCEAFRPSSNDFTTSSWLL